MNDEKNITEYDEHFPNAGNSRSLPSAVSNDVVTVLQQIQHNKLVALFGQVFSGVQVSQEFVERIDKAKMYIAKIPKHLQDEFSAGDLQFMVKNDTGENLGVIVGADKRNRGFVRIEEAAPVNSDLAGSLASLAMQQQLAQIAAAIDEVRSRVVELKTIHDRDLLGTLRGMHTQLIAIKDASNENNRINLTISAITVLNDTLGRIEQRLLDELDKLPEVPKNKVLAGIKVFWSTGYYQKLQQGYELIQELFDYYLSCLQMLSYAYAFLGEDQVAANVFVPTSELCKNPNLSKLVRAEALCADEVLTSAWYRTPKDYLQRISSEAERIFQNNVQLAIEITGEQLMEVLSYAEGS